MTPHADGIRTSAKHRVSGMSDAMIAMTHDASWKRSRFKGFLVRAFFVHLGLESVTVRTHILNLVYSWRRRAMVSMTRCTGRRAQIASHRERFVVHARAVLCKLIRGNGISLHVTRVRMAASARVRHVDRIDRGAGIAGGPQIVDTMTIRAHCNLRVSGREALAVHTGAVLAQLVGAQAGVELPNIRRIRMALPHNCGICLRSILPFHPAFRLMALSGSSLVGSPPWQLAQVRPFCACMSWLNFSWLTPSGSGKAE